MHDAYEPVPILEKLPIQIDCLAAWGKCFGWYKSLFFVNEVVFFSLYLKFFLQMTGCLWGQSLDIFSSTESRKIQVEIAQWHGINGFQMMFSSLNPGFIHVCLFFPLQAQTDLK